MLVRKLDQAQVAAIAADQRCRQPATHGRVVRGMRTEAAPARMGLQFGLGHAYRPILLAHPGVDARPIRIGRVVAPLRVFLGQCRGVHRLAPVFAAGQAHHALVRTDDAARSLGDGLQRAFEGLGAGRFQCGFSQLQQLLRTPLQLRFHLVLGGAVAEHLEEAHAFGVQPHHQARAPEPGAVAAQVPAFVGRTPLPAGLFHLAFRIPAGTVLWNEEQRLGLAQDLPLRIAHHALGTGVPAGDPGLVVQADDGEILGALHDLAVAVLAGRQGGQGLDPVGDVMAFAEDAGDAAIGIAQRLEQEVEIASRFPAAAVGRVVHGRLLHLHTLSSEIDLVEQFEHALALKFREGLPHCLAQPVVAVE